jgi:hypothetical protein
MAIPLLTSSNFLRAAIAAAAMAVGGVALAAEYELVSTVALSRHGVRSPIAGHPAPATFAADTWPHGRYRPGISRPEAPSSPSCSEHITESITRRRGCFQRVAARQPAEWLHGRT